MGKLNGTLQFGSVNNRVYNFHATLNYAWFVGLFLVNNIQTPLPTYLPHSKVVTLAWKMRNVLKFSVFYDLYFLRYSLKILIRLKNGHLMTKLLSFAPILLATRSNCVSEDSKNMKKSFAIKSFLSKIGSWSVAKKNFNKIGANKDMLGGLRPPIPPNPRGASSPTLTAGCSAPRHRMLLDWIPLANWLSGWLGGIFFK